MLAWMQLKAKWSHETQAQVVHEFLTANKLFAALVQFARKRP
jgi:hypothetical protein